MASGVALIVTLLTMRQRTYCRLIRYNPKQDCFAGFNNAAIEMIPVRCDVSGFIFPELKPNARGGFLELDVRASTAGALLDPAVEIHARGFRDTQVLERGVRGVRFLNVSRLLVAGIMTGERVALRGERLAWQTNSARLHICREMLQPAERILVLSPHPDDAEIAAFGLSADTNATVVTITAGDGSDRYSSKEKMSLRLPRATVARMRVWDSITVPQLGGIGLEKAINLCYPDGKLSAMHAEHSRDFRGEGGDALNFEGLRKLNRSPLIHEGSHCSWKSLVHDLAHILAEVKPTIIVTPHPSLDSHLDHLFTTVAIDEAMKDAGLVEGRFYFYVNHNRQTELWPLGPSGSGVALLPLLKDDKVECAGFYSHPLSEERQREKFLALEAMHDLRDIGLPEPQPILSRLRSIRSEMSALLHGMGLPPTSYLRRAVRPDELFFTTSFVKGHALCERILLGN
jgi:LmbE family N-acetylglucosaminyl deacetylase